jgi:hypothetical protein
MTFLSPNKMLGREKVHPGLGAYQSEKLELARSLCDSGSITKLLRLLSQRVEQKKFCSGSVRYDRSGFALLAGRDRTAWLG